MCKGAVLLNEKRFCCLDSLDIMMFLFWLAQINFFKVSMYWIISIGCNCNAPDWFVFLKLFSADITFYLSLTKVQFSFLPVILYYKLCAFLIYFFVVAHKHHILYGLSFCFNCASPSDSWARGFLLPKGGDLHLIEAHKSAFIYPSVSVWVWKTEASFRAFISGKILWQ